ncbi:hypothetical protein H0H87_004343 [Tephrocybe sp. NHM501043]|nr:hypothetical protein H0H87_004343 [Tephrocybe sp. NHM501043]
MSIDVHEAIKAIRDMLPIIDPEEDYLTIVAAEEKLSATEQRRKKEIDDAQANVKTLAKQLEAARISSKRPASVPSEQAHAKILNELDRMKLDLMKSISDMEGLVASQEAELASLKDEARQLEGYDPALEHKKELDGTALRSRMYTKLGFESILDKKGDLIKVLVRMNHFNRGSKAKANSISGAQSGDVYVVPIDEHKSNFEKSRVLWKLASS